VTVPRRSPISEQTIWICVELRGDGRRTYAQRGEIEAAPPAHTTAGERDLIAKRRH
jgi:hypothetical protein